MKPVYFIRLTMPNDVTIYESWYHGDTEQEAIITAVSSHLEHHNKYSSGNKLMFKDITVVSSKLIDKDYYVWEKLSHGF